MTDPVPGAVCSGCGLVAPRGSAEPGEPGGTAVPWTWSVSRESERTAVLCEGCAREHARSIEAKLDTDWW